MGAGWNIDTKISIKIFQKLLDKLLLLCYNVIKDKKQQQTKQ